jgi:hypothetical protein
MFGSKRNKESERFYLLPGQGGRAHRRKQIFFFKWSVAAGLLGAAILGVVMYWLNHPNF